MGFGKDGKGIIVIEQTVVTLGGLAGQDSVIGASDVSLDSDFRILKSELTCVLTGMTSLEGAGFILYMTEGEISAAEGEANVELDGPERSGDQTAEEVASRWVCRVGILMPPTVNETERVMTNEYGGGILTLKPRWTFRRGRTAANGGWNWMIYNDGVNITTGASVRIMATHYGVWVT